MENTTENKSNSNKLPDVIQDVFKKLENKNTDIQDLIKDKKELKDIYDLECKELYQKEKIYLKNEIKLYKKINKALKSKDCKNTNNENIYNELQELSNNKKELMETKKKLKDTYETEYKDIYQKIKVYLKNDFKFSKELKKLIEKLSKTKKKNKNHKKQNKFGFNEPRDIPEILKKFIGSELLSETDYEKNNNKLSRTKVYSLMNTKFKNEGCKKGKELIISNKVAKALKLKKGSKYNFSEQHKLLATFYPPKVKKNNV